jgi:hypothetical protein
MQRKQDYRIIFETDDKVYRIVELPDDSACMEDLKGDTYNPKINTDISPEQLHKEELEFEDLVSRTGVYGYMLERWNSEPGKGCYEHIDSCFGFVGQYSESDKSDISSITT